MCHLFNFFFLPCLDEGGVYTIMYKVFICIVDGDIHDIIIMCNGYKEIEIEIEIERIIMMMMMIMNDDGLA